MSTSRYWRQLRDGELALPKILELPLVTHTHDWGPLYEGHINDYTNPHKVVDTFKDKFIEKHYWDVHIETYKAILQALTSHVTDFDAHPEIWKPLLAEFEAHTHPDPKPLVSFDTDTPQTGQLFRNSEGMFGIQGNVSPIWLGTEGAKLLSELLIESGFIPETSLENLQNPIYGETINTSEVTQEASTTASLLDIFKTVSGSNYLEQLANFSEKLLGGDFLQDFTQLEKAELGMRLLELGIPLSQHYAMHTYMPSIFKDFTLVRENIKSIYECDFSKAGFRLAFTFTQGIPFTGLLIPSVQQTALAEQAEGEAGDFYIPYVKISGGDYLYRIKGSTYVIVEGCCTFDYEQDEPTLEGFAVSIQDKVPPAFTWYSPLDLPSETKEKLLEFKNFFEENGQLPPILYAYISRNFSVLREDRIEVAQYVNREEYNWLDPGNITFFSEGKIYAPYRDAVNNPITAGKEEDILQSVQRGNLILEQYTPVDYTEVDVPYDFISHYKDRVQEILGEEVGDNVIQWLLKLHEKVALLPPEEYRKISILLALLEVKNYRWTAIGKYLLATLNPNWSYTKLGGNLQLRLKDERGVIRKLRYYDEVEAVEEPNLYLLLQPQSNFSIMFSIVLLLSLLEIVQNKHQPKYPIFDKNQAYVLAVDYTRPEAAFYENSGEDYDYVSILPSEEFLEEIVNVLNDFAREKQITGRSQGNDWYMLGYQLSADITASLAKEITPQVSESNVYEKLLGDKYARYIEYYCENDLPYNTLGGATNPTTALSGIVSDAINILPPNTPLYSLYEIYQLDSYIYDTLLLGTPRVGIFPVGARQVVSYIVKLYTGTGDIEKISPIFPFRYISERDREFLVEEVIKRIKDSYIGFFSVNTIPINGYSDFSIEDLYGTLVELPVYLSDEYWDEPIQTEIEFSDGSSVRVHSMSPFMAAIWAMNLIHELVDWSDTSPIAQDLGYLLYELTKLREQFFEGDDIYLDPYYTPDYYNLFEEDKWRVDYYEDNYLLPVLAGASGSPYIEAYMYFGEDTDFLSACTANILANLFDVVSQGTVKASALFSTKDIGAYAPPTIEQPTMIEDSDEDDLWYKFLLESPYLNSCCFDYEEVVGDWGGSSYDEYDEEEYDSSSYNTVRIPALVTSNTLNNWFYFFAKKDKINYSLLNTYYNQRDVKQNKLTQLLVNTSFLAFTRVLFPEFGLPYAHALYFIFRNKVGGAGSLLPTEGVEYKDYLDTLSLVDKSGQLKPELMDALMECSKVFRPDQLTNWEIFLNPFLGKQIEAGKLRPYTTYHSVSYTPFTVFDIIYI